MRDRYYRVTSPSDLPQSGVLVHLYRRLGQVVARVEGDIEEDEAQPDLILFRAALMRLRDRGVGIFVMLEDPTLWQAAWGELVDYRGGRNGKGPVPHQVPTLSIEPDVRDASDFTLSRFRTAKP